MSARLRGDAPAHPLPVPFSIRCPPPPHADLFEARRDPGAMVPRRPDAVHVYGVDLMSTGDLLKYFADYGAA